MTFVCTADNKWYLARFVAFARPKFAVFDLKLQIPVSRCVSCYKTITL
jgi:hypothetical protein